MLRWLGQRKAPEPTVARADPIPSILQDDDVTDDPLAALAAHQQGQKQIYSVTRSVFLPRVNLKNTSYTTSCTEEAGVNPLFRDTPEALNEEKIRTRQRSPHPGEKSSSSGYGGSYSGIIEPLYTDNKMREEVVVLEERKISRTGRNRSLPSSGSSGAGTLTTIPEGKVDLPVPKPIWPILSKQGNSFVDDALLLYSDGMSEDRLDFSVKEILVELLNSINTTMDGSSGLTPEEMLKCVNEKIAQSIETLKMTTEDEMKRLCVNLSNCRKINSVLRAFSNSTSSGNSSQSSSGRMRTISSDTDELYHIASGSSSSGFSDLNALPIFIHEDLGSMPNGVRNAMIYGTLYRGKSAKILKENSSLPKKNSLRAVNDNKPSVWEQYYGVRATQDVPIKYPAKPTDIPLFPGGRPEADFTLDVPRSELLSKRMKQDKKWRCRCRLLTSFLGLIFFLLSVMAVSLMLTRGKRMFGSMM